MNELYEWVKSIIVVMIVINVISNLLGKSSFKKYAGIVSGLILMLYVIRPVFSFLGKGDHLDFSLQQFQFELQSQEISQILHAAEQNSENAVLNEFQKILYEQTEDLLQKYGLTLLSFFAEIQEDVEKDNYGQILSLHMKASYIKENDTKDLIAQVEVKRVIIGNEEGVKQELQEFLSPMEINIKNVLADFYNLDSSNINIIIREDHNE